jgi:hypothetical protein
MLLSGVGALQGGVVVPGLATQISASWACEDVLPLIRDSGL